MKSEAPDEIDRILDRALLSYSKREPSPGLEDRVLHYVNAGGADSGTVLAASLGVSRRAARPRFLILGWAFAAAVAALLLILVPVVRNHRNSIPDHSQPVSRAEAKTAMPDGSSMEMAPRTPTREVMQAAGGSLPGRAGAVSEDRRGRLSHKTPLATCSHSGTGLPACPDPFQRAAGGARALSLPKQQVFPAPSPITGEERALLAFVNSAPDEALRISIHQAQSDIAPVEVKQIDIEPLRIDGLQQGAE